MPSLANPRTKIDLATTESNLISVLAAGNIGAINAMAHLLNEFSPPDQIYLDIDDMNLRGPRLAAAFDVADRDNGKFRILITNRDEELVNQVNRLAGGVSKDQQAMCHGGSYL